MDISSPISKLCFQSAFITTDEQEVSELKKGLIKIVIGYCIILGNKKDHNHLGGTRRRGKEVPSECWE
jgi:hypothetical protein